MVYKELEINLLEKKGKVEKMKEKIKAEMDDEMMTDMVMCNRLPKLEEDSYDRAVSHENLAWVHGFMQANNNGQATWLDNVGLHLQKVNDNLVRCIAVVDHPSCFLALSMIKLSFETANMEVELAPYTLVMPYIPKENEGSCEDVPGLEVA